MPFITGMLTGVSANQVTETADRLFMTAAERAKLGAAINVLDYGADPTGAANSNDAFRLASEAISAANGGVLVIPPGAYTIGKQTFAGSAGLQYSYRSDRVLYFENVTGPITVMMSGVTMTTVPGLKYGSFSPTTGVATVGQNSTLDNRAYCPNHLRFVNCTGLVSVIGPAVLDGNVVNLTIGGPWGSSGFQTEGSGLRFDACRGGGILVAGVACRNHPLDGIQIEDANSTSFSAARANVLMFGVSAHANQRQGLSVTGGHGMRFDLCQFRETGWVLDTSPRAGIDIEPNAGTYISNIDFVNCDVSDNKSCQLLQAPAWEENVSDITVSRSRIVGSSGYNNCSGRRWRYINCYFSGSRFSTTRAAAFDGDRDCAVFDGCVFDDVGVASRAITNTSDTNNYISSPGAGTMFRRCQFSNPNYAASGRNNVIYDQSTTEPGCIYEDCTFKFHGTSGANNSSVGLVRHSRFEGRNVVSDVSESGNSYFVTHDANNYRLRMSNAAGLTFPSTIRLGAGYGSGITGDVAAMYGETASRYFRVGDGTSSGSARIGSATGIPTAGQFYRGDLLLNSVAAVGQPIGWVCTSDGYRAAAWAGSTAYGVGVVRKNGSNFYTCTSSGTSAASGGPTGTGSGISDGTAAWSFLSSAEAAFTAAANL